jgi:actin-related protein
VKIDSGYFTLKEIQDRKLLFQADPVYVQLDAIPKSVEILAKAYQNICEQTELELGLENKIMSNLREWSVVIAIAAFETDEARKSVEDIHIEAVRLLGFKSFYINTQIMFDYISQINHMKELGLREGYGFIVNIGGGDTEIAAISGVPLMHTFRRYPLAGQDVTLYCEKVLQEELLVTGVMINTIEEWLIEGGSVLKDSPDTIKLVKRREVNIKKILDAPALLFDYKNYYHKERRFNSITEIVRDSIEAAIMSSSSSFDDALALILSAVIIVGGGANYRGIAQRLENELKAEFKEYMNDIQVITGSNPQLCGINGMRQLIKMKYKEGSKGLNFRAFELEN